MFARTRLRHLALCSCVLGTFGPPLFIPHVRADTIAFGANYSQVVVLQETAHYSGGAYQFTYDYDNIFYPTVPKFNSAWGTFTSSNMNASANVSAIYDLNGGGGEWFFLNDDSYLSSLDHVITYASAYGLVTDDPLASGEQIYPLTSANTVYSTYNGTFGAPIGTGNVTLYAYFDLYTGDTELYGPETLTGPVVSALNFTATYTYTPATTSSGGGNPPAVGSGGGSGLITNQPVGGWTGNLLIGSNGVLNITTGDSLIAPSAENYGIINQTGGNFTLSGNLHQVMNFYSDTNGSTKGIYNISGGTASFGGITGNGFVNISGGTLTATTVNHTGVITQTSGTFNATTFTQTGTQYLDANGNQAIGGTFAISGGSAYVGTLNNAGTLTVSGSGYLQGSYIHQTDSTYIDMSTGNTRHFGVFAVSGGSANLDTVDGNGHVIVSDSGYLAVVNITASLVSVKTSGVINVDSGLLDAGKLCIDSTGIIELQEGGAMIVRDGLTLSEVQALLATGATSGTSGIFDPNPYDASIGYFLSADTAGDLGISEFFGVSVDSTDIIVQALPETEFNAMIMTNPSTVPEPASLSVLVIGGVALLKRRR